jgi:transposase InsO family protein
LDHGQPPRSPYRPQPTGAQLCSGQARPGLAGRYLSYIATDEGWLYLAAIKDLATREIVGWSMADHLRTELCTDALVMALQYHPPSPGLIHHSDRGVQGGFKWSSQHPLKGSCDAKSKAAVGTGAAVLTWSPTGDRTRREPAVLGGDCGRYGE